MERGKSCKITNILRGGGGKGSEKRPFIVHHDSYQSDEIVMEIEEGNKKLQMIISKERNSII